MTESVRPVGAVRLAAALTGFGCMAAELAAVRVQAPHFGDSAYVWTNVIGVILGALSAGAFVGGRLAARPDAPRWLALALLGSGLLLGLAPLGIAGSGPWLVPPEVPLDAAMPAIVRGSLLATLLWFLPPMLLLGMVAPMLVGRLAAAGVPIGRAAGSISAIGTLGSLAGTFAATHWLVPGFGCRATLLVAAGSVLLAGVLLAAAGRRAPALGGLAILVVGFCLPLGPLREPLPGRELLAEVESRHQYLQVVRERGEAGAARTLLLINEGLDSFHSVEVEGSCFTGGAYYDWHGLVPWLRSGDTTRPLRVLSIGDAAGTLRAVYRGVRPDDRVDAVDLDPACMALGDCFFRQPKAAGERHVLDGRLLVARSRATWDVVHVDAYAHQVYVPAHLASREFFQAVRERLADGGVVCCNVGALAPDDPVLLAIGTTLGAVFGHALAMHVPSSRNHLLVARKGEPPDPRTLAAASTAAGGLAPKDAEHWQGLVATAQQAERWFRVDHGGELLDDDRPVLDALLATSYLAPRRGNSAPTPCTGSQDPAGAEIAAAMARSRYDWPGVLRAVAGAKASSAALREHAGDARWTLRDLHGAAADYLAGSQEATADAARGRLLAKLAAVQEDLAPQLRAEAASLRNGWLVVAVFGVLAALGALTWRRLGAHA